MADAVYAVYADAVSSIFTLDLYLQKLSVIRALNSYKTPIIRP